MIEDELEGEGRRTRLGDHGVCCSSPSSHIYRWGRRRQPRRTPRGRRPALGLLPLAPPPFPYLLSGEGKGRRGKARGGRLPSFLFSPRPVARGGAYQPLVGWCAPLFGPYGPITSRGLPEPLPVIRSIPGTIQNLSGNQIASSYI
jgi:hypothetical protein